MTKIMKGGIAYNSTANMVALTQAEYNSLSTAQKNNGNFYFITDADPSYFSAENIDYDNTDSGLSATDIQGAIDELESGKADISTPIQNLTCPRCAISSFDTYKIQKIGNVIFFSVNLTFGATSQTGGAYFLSNLVDTADFVQGSLFDDIGDKIYEIGKGKTPSIWIKDSASTLPASSLVNKTRMFLNLIIVKAT